MEHFKIQDLNFSYPASGGRLSLDGVTLSVERGEYIALCGRSGSGKTTLLRHLKSALTPHGERSGEIYFNGVLLNDVSDRDQAAKIGFVMQDVDDQIVTDKVWHELAFGLESLGCAKSAMRSRVAEMACYFGIQDWFDKDVASLSGGQKQLLNLASVRAMQPEVLILDEPTSQLDPIAASDFLNTVKRINSELGTTVIISEHRLEDVLPSADRAFVMEAGRIGVLGTPDEIGAAIYERGDDMFRAMPTPVRVFCGAGGTGISPLTVKEGRAWLESSFPDGEAADRLPEAPDDRNKEYDIALSVKEAWFRYEKNEDDVLRGVSAEVPAGCIYAIVGGNGAGKSTLLRAVCDICRPYRGKIKVFGRDVRKYGKDSL
ncbi:MAG: ABC transporter ATP-binding protein, partial [Clostridia bacterium]|nr:ABC transporter ATP-binding protein [Clostridia bacterium]